MYHMKRICAVEDDLLSERRICVVEAELHQRDVYMPSKRVCAIKEDLLWKANMYRKRRVCLP